MNGSGRFSRGAGAALLATTAVVFVVTMADAARIGDTLPATEGASPAELSEVGSDAPVGLTGGEAAGSTGERVTPSQLQEGVAPRRLGIYPRVSQDELLAAVNQDLFLPDRAPPLERYLLPGDRPVFAPRQQDPRRRRGPNIRIVGSAIMGETALALVQVDDFAPLALWVGESVEGYILASVEPEMATLVGADGTLNLPVEEPVLRDQPRASPGEIRIEGRDLEALQGRVQDMLRNQFLMQRGGPQDRSPAARRGRGGGGQS